nr:hypothetical protein [Allosphingosinicella sp.]
MADSTFEESFANWSDYMDAIRDQSELGRTLITASFLDSQLERIIRSFMVEDRLHKDIFEGPTSPLGSFSSKINMAHAMGLIDDQEYRTLHAIRAIRNELAHNMKTTIGDLRAKGKLDNLAWAIGADAVGKHDHFEVFMLGAQRTIMALLNRADHVRGERRQPKEWPHERTDADPDWTPY